MLTVFRKKNIKKGLYNICYHLNTTTKAGTVGKICLDNLKDKRLLKTNEAQAIKPLGRKTKLYAMNNIYIQSEHQVQITFLFYQECATFCLSNHCTVMIFKR
uniref:Uncharacterized protein n=1 Tax=Nothoprocta perdicaria TaxID=30464 RepID=A0A8C6ZVA1_NOTPE